tara:strand:+ start:19065 stop:19310 length:246 start_codon:yes stop_codon:yes gene_type:complete
MSINKIVELIKELELMVGTINTDHENYEGSIEEMCFKEHQKNIIELKAVFNKYTTMQTALRNIRSIGYGSISDIANIALTA